LLLLGEALSRIQEKEAILQNRDVGRDTKSVQSLIRKHEAFENDLVALEAQLQVLLDDSAALQDKYPGENKCHGSLTYMLASRCQKNLLSA
jgi:spectrin beta